MLYIWCFASLICGQVKTCQVPDFGCLILNTALSPYGRPIWQMFDWCLCLDDPPSHRCRYIIRSFATYITWHSLENFEKHPAFQRSVFISYSLHQFLHTMIASLLNVALALLAHNTLPAYAQSSNQNQTDALAVCKEISTTLSNASAVFYPGKHSLSIVLYI